MAEDAPKGSYQTQLLCVELTKLFIPNATLLDIFCAYSHTCACPQNTPHVTRDPDNYSGEDCTGALSVAPDSADACPPFDFDTVPDWFLEELQHRFCTPIGLFVFPRFCDAVKCIRQYGPPTSDDPVTGGTCWAFYFEWQAILARWQSYGETYLAKHCGSYINPADEPNTDVLKVQKTRVRFPAGTQILGMRHITMILDEPCELCA